MTEEKKVYSTPQKKTPEHWERLAQSVETPINNAIRASLKRVQVPDMGKLGAAVLRGKAIEVEGFDQALSTLDMASYNFEVRLEVCQLMIAALCEKLGTTPDEVVKNLHSNAPKEG